MKDSIHIVVLFSYRAGTRFRWRARLPTDHLYYVLRPVINPILGKMNG